ncbi:MAG TPA: type III pantothenate kinase [Chitinophagales bacterium]
MNLCIDIGNSYVKFGWFKENELVLRNKGVDALLQSNPTLIEHAILSSVTKDETVTDWLKKNKIPYITLSSQLRLPFTLAYETPETLGSDRIAAAAGMTQIFPHQNMLVITAGSCVTYNFVSKHSEFLGGAISPGLKMRLDAMSKFTSKLPKIKLNKDEEIPLIGRNTENSMLSGAANGLAAEIDGIISQYKNQYENLNTVICGGDAAFLSARLKNNIFVSPSLVLDGLNYILRQNAA